MAASLLFLRALLTPLMCCRAIGWLASLARRASLLLLFRCAAFRNDSTRPPDGAFGVVCEIVGEW